MATRKQLQKKSRCIADLSGAHIGKKVIIVEQTADSTFTITGLLHSVSHTADRVTHNTLAGYPAVVQRPSCHVNIDGRGLIRLSDRAIFTLA